MEPTVFRFVGGTLENAAFAFLSPVLDLVVTTISGVVSLGVILYVLVVGLLIVLGYIERPIGAFVGKSLKIIIVTGVALSADAYGTTVADGITGLESMLAGALNITDTTATSIYQVLDQSFGRGLDLTARCFQAADNASWRAFGSIVGWTLAGLIIALGATITTLLGGAVIIVAKFALLLRNALICPVHIVTHGFARLFSRSPRERGVCLCQSG